MKAHINSQIATSLRKLVPILVTFAVLLGLFFVGRALLVIVAGTFSHDYRTYSLSNAKQLHLATQQMAIDGVSIRNPALGWPGDTGGRFDHWAHQLIEEQYLTTNDFRKLMSAPGVRPPEGRIPAMKDCALLVYATGTNSPANAVFLTTANFTNTPTGGSPPTREAKPFGDKGFVVFRQDGDGAILRAKQAGETNIVGSFVPLCQ